MLVALTSLACLARANAAPADGEATPRLPARNFSPLPGTVVGVLQINCQALLHSEGRKGPADALALGVGAGSLRWLYLQGQKKPMIGALRIPLGPDGKQKQRFDRLNLATLPALKDAGITEPFTLVEVEVNGGAGCPATEIFVATAIRPVEGSKRYPLHVASVVEQLQQHYQKWIATQRAQLEGALATERQKLGYHPVEGTARNEEQLVYATWIPDSQVLQVQIRTRLKEKDPLPPSSVSTRNAQEDEPVPQKNMSRVIGVETGFVYHVSRTGVLLHKDANPVQGFNRLQAEPDIKRAAVKK